MYFSYTSQFPLLPTVSPEMPWRLSASTYARLYPSSDNSYKEYELSTSDPEFAFVHRYFHAQQPTNRELKRVICIHQESQSYVFENNIPVMDVQTTQDAFRPKWSEGSNNAERKEVMKRFARITQQFSPFSILANNRSKQTVEKVKVLPVWHGSDKKKCQSIFQSGFTYFGKHFYHGTDTDNQSRDIGYFGNGMYFTTSARYAADIYSDGQYLLLAWISMREPYPVINDIPLPGKGSDMRMLEGTRFQNYDTHYIPVVSIDPQNKKCAIYYPCYKGQEPDCDEIVVFNSSQTLLRFAVEMCVALPTNIKEAPLTILGVCDLVSHLLQQEEIKKHPQLLKLLEEKAQALVVVKSSPTISQSDYIFYHMTKQLLDEGKKVRLVVAEWLMNNAKPGSSNSSNEKMLSISSSNKIEVSVQTLRGHTSTVNCLVALDDNTIASASEDRTIKIWNNGTCIRTLTDVDNNNNNCMRQVEKLLRLHDGILVSRSYDGLRLWDTGRGSHFRMLNHPETVSSFIETKEGKLAIAGRDKTIKFWDLTDGSIASSSDHTQWVRVVLQLQDGSLASGSDDGTIKIRDRDGVLTLKGHTASVRALIQLKNGNLVSGSEDRTIKIWTRWGECLYTCQHGGSVNSLRELRDGTIVSDSMENRLVKQWDLQGNLIFAYPGHKHYVEEAPLELHNGVLAICANNNIIDLWDHGKFLLALKGHTDCVETLIEPKKGYLASGSRDGTVRLWTLPS